MMILMMTTTTTTTMMKAYLLTDLLIKAHASANNPRYDSDQRKKVNRNTTCPA